VCRLIILLQQKVQCSAEKAEKIERNVKRDENSKKKAKYYVSCKSVKSAFRKEKRLNEREN
jgi:hypothetical protein